MKLISIIRITENNFLLQIKIILQKKMNLTNGNKNGIENWMIYNKNY
jgi:hypothetical protein